jgi:hypothetical protein
MGLLTIRWDLMMETFLAVMCLMFCLLLFDAGR